MSKNQTCASGAQSPSESVIAQARALEPTIRKLLEGVNAILDSRADSMPPHEDSGCHPNDKTGNRLRAYVASMRGLRGIGEYNDDVDEAQQRGRSLIERLALTAEDTGLPRLMLTAEQVADVLAFMASQEPIALETWWNEDVGDEPSHLVGFYLLLQALESSLRRLEAKPSAAALGDFQGDLRGVLGLVRMAERDLPTSADLSTAADALERLCERLERAQEIRSEEEAS